jgi:aspartate carbamoyltransferase regulatory subunit
MVLDEHSQIVLVSPVMGDEGEKLEPGDVGVIVHIHPGGEAIVAEFLTLAGETAAIATVLLSQMRQVTNKDILHTREFALAA